MDEEIAHIERVRMWMRGPFVHEVVHTGVWLRDWFAAGKGRFWGGFPRFHGNPQEETGARRENCKQSSTVCKNRGWLWRSPVVMHRRPRPNFGTQIIQRVSTTYPRVIHNPVDRGKRSGGGGICPGERYIYGRDRWPFGSSRSREGRDLQPSRFGGLPRGDSRGSAANSRFSPCAGPHKVANLRLQ